MVQQAITSANADPVLCPHMASLGHNEFIELILFSSNRNTANDVSTFTCKDAHMGVC